MKKILLAALLAWAWGGLSAWGQTTPIYINSSPVFAPPSVAPQIDASAFVNRSVFSISVFFGIDPIPFETYNTRYFTNTSAGVMSGDPGFLFEYANENVRLPMASFVNQGSISCDSLGLILLTSGGFLLTTPGANWLTVSATNIVNPGRLSVGSQGILKLEGQTVDLAGAGLRSGSPLTNSGFFFGSSVLASNYVNDVGITDLYWGTGTNNAVGNNGMLMNLTGGGLNALLYPPLSNVRSPYHEVIQSFSGINFTSIVAVPFSSFGTLYQASVYTSQVNPTNSVIQIVFAPTNFFDTNFSTEVRFYPDFGDNGATVAVGFHSAEFDIVSQTTFTNSVYLIDALAFETNVFLARNPSAMTRRPRTFDFTRNEPFFGTYNNGNAVYTNTMIYNPATYASNSVEVLYAGYEAQLTFLNLPASVPVGSSSSNPTNFPGRVEILAADANLDRTRIRADSTLILRAPNVRSNRFAQVDAPYLVYDIGTTQPLLLISNMAPPTVRRLSGFISAWSGTWRNYETNATTTNAIDFHVLIVDPSFAASTPVSMQAFRIKATNTLITDPLTVAQDLRVDTRALNLRTNFTLPFNVSWGATNFINLYHLTNAGLLSMSGSGFFGTDRPLPYSNIVNRGTMAGASMFLAALNFDNSGIVGANGGLLTLQALQASLMGKPTQIFTNIFTNIFFGFTNIVTDIVTNSIGATLGSSSDLEIHARDLVLSNSILHAGQSLPGLLVLSITNRLVDSGQNALNYWFNSSGAQLLRKPAQSDLLATHLRCSAAQFINSMNLWAADDLGPTSQGYENNAALGKLILDGRGSLSRFDFAGTAPGRALYVDYLQLENFATNYNSAFFVADNLTVYFAGSNVPVEKLDGAANGRLRWVRYFAGPNTTTNLTYPSGTTHALNVHLVQSLDLDSDGDGIVNGEDPTPVFVPEQVDLTAALTGGSAGSILLSWSTIANSTNVVEFKPSLAPGVPWQVRTTIINGPVNARLEFQDGLSTNQGQRYYRIHVDPQ